MAWLALDAGDNDPVRFWRYVFTDGQRFAPDLGIAALAQLHTPQPPSFETLLTIFINELARLSDAQRNILVLEDYHVITNSQIHASVTFLIDHLPPTLHLVMTTRRDPPLPLARLRACLEINELTAADLRLSAVETQTFLQQTLALPLSPEIIARLEARTEGWVTGLRLVALALQARHEPEAITQFVDTFSGSHRHILEYLAAEVLTAQLPAMQEFLLHTTFLSRLCAPLCDAILERADSTLMLEQLDQANLFLVRLEEEPRPAPHPFAAVTWYRYHALFAEAMQVEAGRRLGADCLRQLSHKASLWYEAQGALAEAIESALVAQQFERVALLLERLIAPQLMHNEFHTLRRWIAQLPVATLRPHPDLCFSYAIAILFTSDRYAPATRALLEPPLAMAEEQWRCPDNQRKLGELLAFRALVAWFQRDLTDSFAHARHALALLPVENRQWRGISLIFVGLEELWAGQFAAARQTLFQAVELNKASSNTYGVLDALLLLGQVCSQQGALQEAARHFQQVLTLVEQAPLRTELAQIRRGRALLGLSMLDLAWNRLETAEHKAGEAYAICQEYPDEDLLRQDKRRLAQVKYAGGEYRQAQELLQSFIAQTVQHRWPFLHREAQVYQARLALAAGDPVMAHHWLTTLPQPSVALPYLDQEHEALINARWLLAQGNADAALRLLEPWLTAAQAGERTRSVISGLTLQALAYFQQNDLPQAKATLRQALTLAQPEGEQWFFLEMGAPLVELLRALFLEVKTEPLVGYLRDLLLAFAQREPNRETTQASAAALLLEPLSPQEERVLRLLAAGLSNPEIARELIVSVNTVKTQVQSIFRKLNVNNRQEARAAARQLTLR